MIDSPTVRAVVERFLAHAVATDRYCPESLEERQRVLLAFALHAGDRLVADCCADHLGEWIESNPTWKATNTRRSKAHQVNAAFNWAAKVGRIPRNPFASISYEEGEPRPATPDPLFEQVALRANYPMRRMLWFMREVGCRPCELRKILWEEVDWEKQIIVHIKHKNRKKTRKPRIIVLTPAALALLKDLQAEGGVTGAIFRNQRGEPWKKQALVLHWQRLRARAKVAKAPNATMHGIRHQFGTTAIRNNGNIKLISLAMGHASVTTTEKYYVQCSQDVDAIRREVAKAKKVE